MRFSTALTRRASASALPPSGPMLLPLPEVEGGQHRVDPKGLRECLAALVSELISTLAAKLRLVSTALTKSEHFMNSMFAHAPNSERIVSR
jgi:hypothetical protein